MCLKCHDWLIDWSEGWNNKQKTIACTRFLNVCTVHTTLCIDCCRRSFLLTISQIWIAVGLRIFVYHHFFSIIVIIIIIIALDNIDNTPYKILHKLKSACSIRKNQLWKSVSSSVVSMTTCRMMSCNGGSWNLCHGLWVTGVNMA